MHSIAITIVTIIDMIAKVTINKSIIIVIKKEVLNKK